MSKQDLFLGTFSLYYIPAKGSSTYTKCSLAMNAFLSSPAAKGQLPHGGPVILFTAESRSISDRYQKKINNNQSENRYDS